MANGIGQVSGWWLAAVVVLLTAQGGLAAAPAALTPGPAIGPNRVFLDWPAVTDALSYNVKRAESPAGPFVLVANRSAGSTDFSDTGKTVGVRYYYAVSTVLAAGEGTDSRLAAASPGVVVDNLDSASITATGSWPVSGLAGCYSNNSVYAASTAAADPTATFRFSPSLPFFGNYDIYIRWPAYVNRSTATPVDIRYADGALTTMTLDQTQGGSTWVLLGTFPCVSGTSCSVTVRNNTGLAGVYVAADAVQFVPHLAPWTPRGIKTEDYTLVTFSDECSGSSLDPTVWSTALGRTNVSIGSGKISLDVTYIGPGNAATASDEELQSPYNWLKGAVMPVRDQKFGYYETRFRVVQKGGGVDCAFWMQSRGSLLPYENFEFDSPETFPNADLSETDLIYGMWNHTGGSPPWRMNKITYPKSWGEKFHTYGMAWQTDNVLVHYLDGEEIGRTSGVQEVNSIGCMAPIETYLSCYVGNYWLPAGSIDGQSMKVDYLRTYQKPGWTGAAGAGSKSWGDARNWGPDGVPGSGEAAMFNLAVAQPVVSLLGTKSLQSLCFDGPEVSPMVIEGAYPLELGVGGTSVEQGGISMGSAVTNDQTVAVDLLGRQNLSFINNSHSGAALVLAGGVDGVDGIRSARFAVNAPIVVTQPLGASLGTVIKWGRVNFDLPAGSAYGGGTEIAMGVVSFDHLANGGQNSGLGRSSASAANLSFVPRSKYADENQRPRLCYTGPAASTDRGLTIGFFCDAVLEASGSGPVVWKGPVAFDAGNTGAAMLEFGGVNAQTNTYAGAISDTAARNPSGDVVSLKVRKRGVGRWILSGANAWRGTTEVLAGTLAVSGSLTNTTGLSVSADATLEVSGRIHVSGKGANAGTLRLVGDAVLSCTGTFTNTGVLDVMTWNGTLPAGWVNTGVVLGREHVRVAGFSRASAASASLSVTGFVGHVYQLQQADALSGPWFDQGSTRVGDGRVLEFDITAGPTSSFYRISAGP